VRRAVLVLTLLVCALGAGGAQARTTLPGLLARQIKAVHRAHPFLTVLLPTTMALDAGRLYGGGGPDRHGYELMVGAVPHCTGDACFVADFTARRGGTVYGQPTRVRGAARAGFVPLSCGASCAPPQLDFVVHGVRYTIQARLRSSRHDRATLVAAAEAAIRAGAR
jgi:hypothetical protein